jgi:hypothetical protein
MKKIIILGLLAFGVTETYSMTKEEEKEEKNWEKDFRRNLAGDRGAYTLQQFLKATGQTENEYEMKLRIEYEDFLKAYKEHHQFSQRTMKNDFDKLEKFKNKSVQNFFNTCNTPVNSVVSGYSQPTDKTQKDFCRILAGCRGSCTLQMFLSTTKQRENNAEKNLREDYEKDLNEYKTNNPNNLFITTNAEKLDILKQEAQEFFAKCKK